METHLQVLRTNTITRSNWITNSDALAIFSNVSMAGTVCPWDSPSFSRSWRTACPNVPRENLVVCRHTSLLLS